MAEQQYLQMLRATLETGECRNTRNGITYSKFFKTISFDLADGFPLLTTKKMFWKGIVEELLFFIRGDTDTNLLSEKGIRIWELNTRDSFLQENHLPYKEGDMGPMYGYQWRFFNKPYLSASESHETGVDQLKKVIHEIKTNPNSRRILMTTFNPEQVDQGVLYPCHSIVIQFYVEKGRLSCSMYQRSCDIFLGCPFNIASTALLLHIIAMLTNLQPGIVNMIFGDYHIYEEHKSAISEQLTREPYTLCTLNSKKFTTLEEVESSTLDDYQVVNYVSHPPIKAMMIA
jgi:thymidylate synthase